MSGKPTEGRVYAVEMTKTAQRLYKKLDPPVQRRIKAEAEKIAAAPHAAPMLHGLPLPIRSHHFSLAGAQWRIAYILDDDAAKAIVVLVGVRENFYDRLRRVL